MLAKLTAKNQLTLPKAVTDEIGPTEYFDVETRAGQIVLTPVRIQRADAVRARLEALGITQDDVDEAIALARVAEPRASWRGAKPAPRPRDTASSATKTKASKAKTSGKHPQSKR